MKRSRIRVLGATLALIVSAGAVALLGPTAQAASGTAVGTLTTSPSPVLAGTTTSYTFALRTTSGQVSSFNLTAPSDWFIAVTQSLPAGVTRASATQIQGRGITASSSTPLTFAFTATAPCATASASWVLQAKSGPAFSGPTFTNDPSSVLSTPLDPTLHCTAAFAAGPKDSAFLNGAPQNISSVPYQPGEDPIQVIVKDASGRPLSGISVSLNLFLPNPTSATLSAPTVDSDGSGLATFSPVTIDMTGLNYQIAPNAGAGVTATPSDPFGVYQDEKACNGSCTVHGNSSTIHSTVTDDRQGTLSVLVSGVPADVIDCTGTIPDGYSYKPVSTEVTVWQVTGTGSGTQTVVVLVDKSLVRKILNRGSSHIDFCYQADNGKTFIDKFNHDASAGPGLLPDCDSTHTNNCIVSETGVNGGDRLITVTVDDGKGRP